MNDTQPTPLSSPDSGQAPPSPRRGSVPPATGAAGRLTKNTPPPSPAPSAAVPPRGTVPPAEPPPLPAGPPIRQPVAGLPPAQPLTAAALRADPSLAVCVVCGARYGMLVPDRLTGRLVCAGGCRSGNNLSFATPRIIDRRAPLPGEAPESPVDPETS